MYWYQIEPEYHQNDPAHCVLFPCHSFILVCSESFWCHSCHSSSTLFHFSPFHSIAMFGTACYTCMLQLPNFMYGENCGSLVVLKLQGIRALWLEQSSITLCEVLVPVTSSSDLSAIDSTALSKWFVVADSMIEVHTVGSKDYMYREELQEPHGNSCVTWITIPNHL